MDDAAIVRMFQRGGELPGNIENLEPGSPGSDIANAAQVMVTQIGVVSGIQVVSTIQGGSSSAGSFTLAYLAGGIVAVVGIVGAAFVQSADRPARLSVAQAA